MDFKNSQTRLNLMKAFAGESQARNRYTFAACEAKKQKFATREYTRCKICGRPHAVLKKYGICRICFRELASKGEIPGVKKSSW